jgi:hypothetical protein
MMANIQIRFSDVDKPEISLDDSDVFLDSTPLVVLNYSGFNLYLSKSAMWHLKDALKDGGSMLENYRRFMEADETLPLF